MPPHPSTSEGSALRKPRAKQGNRFLAHRLPSTARRRTPARCCTRCPAYAPAIKVPARYSAGRAKQHNHARNVKPFPPRRSPGRTLPGQEGGGQCPLPCPAREVCIAGDSAPGRGHTHQRPLVVGLCPPPCLVREVCIAGDSASGRGHTYQRPFVIRQCPLPLPANLSVPLTLPSVSYTHLTLPTILLV